jgi:LPXTG-motif cell wall-anchored protein
MFSLYLLGSMIVVGTGLVLVRRRRKAEGAVNP